MIQEFTSFENIKFILELHYYNLFFNIKFRLLLAHKKMTNCFLEDSCIVMILVLWFNILLITARFSFTAKLHRRPIGRYSVLRNVLAESRTSAHARAAEIRELSLSVYLRLRPSDQPPATRRIRYYPRVRAVYAGIGISPMVNPPNSTVARNSRLQDLDCPTSHVKVNISSENIFQLKRNRTIPIVF